MRKSLYLLGALAVVLALLISACAPQPAAPPEVEEVAEQVQEAAEQVQEAVEEVAEEVEEAAAEVEEAVEEAVPEEEEPAEEPAAEEPAEEAMDAKVVVMARDSEPLSLNPIGDGSADNGSIFMIVNIFDTLVETQDAPIPQPALAESWEVSDDSLTYTFKLREGAKWSNGDDLTCEDIKYSIDGFGDPEVNTFYSGFGSAIESTECVDETTFVVNLNRVEGAFLDYLSTMPASIRPMAIYEELGSDAFSENPVGSGPFMVREWVRGEKLVLDKNPYYWKEGQPYVDTFVIEYVPDENTRMLKIESGEADIATNVPYTQIERIDALDGVNVAIEDVMAWDAVWFNVTQPPFDDINVIKALNYATPKEAMLDALMNGAGEIANHVIAKVKYWDENVEAYPYDMEQAQEYMAQSSVPDGFDVTCLIVAGDQVERQQAEILQQEWAQLGVNMSIEAVDVGTIWERWTGGGEQCFTYPGEGLSSDALSDDNLAVVFFDFTGGADSFWTSYDSERATELVAQAGQTIDEGEREAAFFELQQLVMDEYPAVPLFFIKARTALKDNVTGFKTLPVKWWNLEDVDIEQ
jgi:peptide/nickel transport system substrate-binding protein